MPAPECSVSKMQNSQPAFAMIWQRPGVKNSNAIWPSATPPLRSFARTGFLRIAPPVRGYVRPFCDRMQRTLRGAAMRRADDKALVAAARRRHHHAGTRSGWAMDSDVRIEAAHA